MLLLRGQDKYRVHSCLAQVGQKAYCNPTYRLAEPKKTPFETRKLHATTCMMSIIGAW
jgi:hypothetical protein